MEKIKILAVLFFLNFCNVESFHIGNISIDTSSLSHDINYWLWGPEATITISTLNSSKVEAEAGHTNLINRVKAILTEPVTDEDKMDVVPLWKQGLTFPLLGQDGVLVKSEPFNACTKVDNPPVEPTLLEEEIEKIETNSSEITSTKYFLVAHEGECDINDKIFNADSAKYYAIIILSTELNKTEELNKTANLKIFPVKINMVDGHRLAEEYTYPEPYVAKLLDLRNTQWTYAIYKIVGITVAVIVVIIGFIAGIAKCMQNRKKKASLKEEEEFREKLHRVIESLPVTVWEMNQLTKDEKCHICYGLFHQNDVVRTYPCYHRFHQRCITSRIDSGRTDCAVCNFKLLGTPERKKSTESTPLL